MSGPPEVIAVPALERTAPAPGGAASQAGVTATLARLPGLGTRAWTLIVRGLWEQRRAVLVWGISLGMLSLFYVVLYPSFRDSLNSYLKNMPPIYLKFLGIEPGKAFDIGSWMSIEMFGLVLPISLPFFAMAIGARTVAGAEERQELDIVLGSPIPRWLHVVARSVVMAVGTLAILVLLALFTWVATLIVGVDLPIARIAAAAFGVWPFCLAFGSLALMLSTLVRRGAVALGAAAGLLVVMYVINGVAATVERVHELRRLSLFSYLGSAIQFGIHWVDFAGILVLAVVLVVLAAALFQRRDIYA